MLVLGTILNVLANLSNINLEVILCGMFSGLASTGCYEMFKNLFNKESELIVGNDEFLKLSRK